MLIEILPVLIVFGVVLPLVAFGLGLLVLSLCELVYALPPWSFFSDLLNKRNAHERIVGIRSIGEQTRRELEQLSFDFLYAITNHKRS